VLRGLSGVDAARADRLLADHVPLCPACRDTLAVFQEATADLALAVEPVLPPETLLPRLHRELGELGPRARRRGPATLIAVAAGFVAVVGLAGLTVSQGIRAGGAQDRADDLTELLDFAGRNNAEVASMDGPAQASMAEVSAPGVGIFYLWGSDVASPPPGYAYRVWLVSGSDAEAVGEFIPDEGFVLLRLRFDPSRFDRILITVEPEGSLATTPSEVVWQEAS
jgi:anti-sigma-K factor RskA